MGPAAEQVVSISMEKWALTALLLAQLVGHVDLPTGTLVSPLSN